MDTIFNADGCFYRALDDEPVFVLLARDPCFAETVRWWVTLRQSLIGQGKKPLEDHSALADAMATAAAGVVWRSDATDPSLFPDGQGKWHKQTVPSRELVETDRLAKLETRLLQNAERFLFYAQNHFDKGTAESEAKGEVNWNEYLEICKDLGIEPADKPVASGEPKSDRDRLNYDDWLNWKRDAMQVGNDFLLGLHKGKLWFSQKHASGEWSDLFMLQKSLQCDIIRGMYNDYRIGQHDKASRLAPMLPDYKSVMDKIACGLRGMAKEYIGVVKGTTWPNKRKDQMIAFADRMKGYARELEADPPKYHSGGVVRGGGGLAAGEVPAILSRGQERRVGKVPELGMGYSPSEETVVVNVPGVTDREQAERLRRYISDPSVKITRKAESDTLDVTDTPDMPPHRFTMFTKAKGWAYGRGLEINPAHIPDMLDRMDADGWHLQCVFGGVVPDKVGMLFRRMDEEVYVRDLPPSVEEMMSASTESEDRGDIGRGRGLET